MAGNGSNGPNKVAGMDLSRLKDFKPQAIQGDLSGYQGTFEWEIASAEAVVSESDPTKSMYKLRLSCASDRPIGVARAPVWTQVLYSGLSTSGQPLDEMFFYQFLHSLNLPESAFEGTGGEDGAHIFAKRLIGVHGWATIRQSNKQGTGFRPEISQWVSKDEYMALYSEDKHYKAWVQPTGGASGGARSGPRANGAPAGGAATVAANAPTSDGADL